jgi:glycerol-3-phosphate dehydrogenase
MPPKKPAPRQHGIKGAYVGGNWVDIEDCGNLFNISNGSGEGNTEAAPRSRTKKSAAKKDGSYDVIIIGSGCIGAAIARELSKFDVSVLILEAADDVTQGATKGNSGSYFGTISFVYFVMLCDAI